MEAHHTFGLLLVQMLLFFGISGILVPLFQHLKISPVLGYLLCGVLLAPGHVAMVAPNVVWDTISDIYTPALVQTLGELGIIALMFTIGLKLSFQQLLSLRHYVFGLGTAQIVVTGGVIYAIARMFGNSVEASILLGASLALSSTAIVTHLLGEKRQLGQPVGVYSFSVLLMQDLAVVPILVVLGIFVGTTDQHIGLVLAQALGAATVAVVLIMVVGKLVLRPLLRTLSIAQTPEWLAALMLFIVIGASSLTFSAGLSAALGAFLAGLLIAETSVRHEVEGILEPIKGMLLGIFFLSVGMLLDIAALLQQPLLVALSVAGLFIIKAAVLFPLARLFRIKPSVAAHSAILLAQGGEFAFMIITLAVSGKLLTAAESQFFLMVTSLSMMLTPLYAQLGQKLAHYIEQRSSSAGTSVCNIRPEQDDFVVLAGLGRSGTFIADILSRGGIPYVGVEKNLTRVEQLRNRGYEVIYGDIKRLQLLKKLGLERARAVVITVDHPETCEEALKLMRQKWPLLTIIVRTHDTANVENLYHQGATHVVPELLESSRALTHHLLEALGRSSDDVAALLPKS